MLPTDLTFVGGVALLLAPLVALVAALLLRRRFPRSWPLAPLVLISALIVGVILATTQRMVDDFWRWLYPDAWQGDKPRRIRVPQVVEPQSASSFAGYVSHAFAPLSTFLVIQRWDLKPTTTLAPKVARWRTQIKKAPSMSVVRTRSMR